MDYKHLVTTYLTWDPKHWFQCDMSLNKATSKVSTSCSEQGIQPTENKVQITGNEIFSTESASVYLYIKNSTAVFLILINLRIFTLDVTNG